MLQCTLWMCFLELFCTFTTCIIAHSQCAFAQCVAHSQHASPDILNMMYVLDNRWNTYYEVINILKLSNFCVCMVNVWKHIHNILECTLWICKIASVSTFTMCIVACVQCDIEFRMGNACYECTIYRSDTYCEYATLLVVNVQIITKTPVHNVHSSMLQMCFDTFTIDTQKFNNFSIFVTSL